MGRRITGNYQKLWATSIIWGCSVGMLGVCVPLVSLTNSGILLPLLVLFCAGGGTAIIWLAVDKTQREEIQLTRSVHVLEERVANLEAIYTSLPDMVDSATPSDLRERP